MKRTVIIFVLALPFIISFAVLIANQRPAAAPALVSPLPNPNGYDQLLAAAGTLQGPVGNFEAMDETDLAALVATNAGALDSAHSALSNECRVPVRYTPAFFSTHSRDMMALKTLGQAMIAQAQLAEMQNHPVAAAQNYLDAVHYGLESGRGGLLIDALVGVSIERMGTTGLENMMTNLDAATCRNAATNLEYLDSRREPWTDISDREDMMRRQTYPNTFGYLFSTVFMHKQLSAGRARAEKTFQKDQAETRSLAVKFAARAYELDKGKPPVSMADLVPTYLKAMPQDPITGKDMVYPP